MGKLLQGEALIERAKELGVSPYTANLHDLFKAGAAGEAELQRRVIEADRHIRDSKLWWIALISALASLFSAIAAWCAVLSR